MVQLIITSFIFLFPKGDKGKTKKYLCNCCIQNSGANLSIEKIKIRLHCFICSSVNKKINKEINKKLNTKNNNEKF